jgi:5-formyltetrahydrofolate cyclo-ligase
MLKKEARTTFRDKRKQLSYQQKLKLDDLLLIRFQKLDFPFLSVLLSFHPIEEKNEVDTFMITRYLQFKNPGLQLAYPKTNLAENSMQAIVCEDEDEFLVNEYNIPEPVKCENIDPQLIDMVLVPLLAFDVKGVRVGYGKGFYDQFLQLCRTDCLKVGLSYFEAVASIDDAGEFDVPLDFCITPHKAYVF